MESLLAYLPLPIARALLSVPEEITRGLTEIRLRLEGPLSLSVGGKNCCINGEGKPCLPQRAFICTEEHIATTLTLLTKGSLYSYGEAMCNGYIPFGKGGRAGICGEARVKDGVLTGFGTVYGINLRLCRFFPDYGAEAAARIARGALKSALVYSPPNRGKTTLLRSIAARLGERYRVALADERGELYVPQLSTGLIDRLTGLKKSYALTMLCRSMSPQIIVCDELAPEDETALHNAIGSGVCIVASAHGDSADSLKKRPFIDRLLGSGAFPLLIGIGEDYGYTVEEYGV